MDQISYIWTNADDPDFRRFYLITEEYYNSLVGGRSNRSGFIPYNLSDSIHDVLVVYVNGTAAACAGLKRYSDSDAEIKRVWAETDQRGKNIASAMMDMIEEKAVSQGFARTVLQTREVMKAAVSLYKKRGYYIINNYPPYDRLEGAVCFAKDLI
ncbi:MAG: GNAT family N-acetyltransferase [Ruminococcus sp.]|nr:GNAT family N-acetyltransferase [Ruminococcus sp.]